MWTYDTGNLATVDEDGRKNIVRLLIGDTDINDPQLQDEAILFALSSNKDNPNVAAIFAINAIISKYARLVNIELDEAIHANGLRQIVDEYNDRLKKVCTVDSHFLRRKCPSSKIATKQRGLIRSWRRNNLDWLEKAEANK